VIGVRNAKAEQLVQSRPHTRYAINAVNALSTCSPDLFAYFAFIAYRLIAKTTSPRGVLQLGGFPTEQRWRKATAPVPTNLILAAIASE
jgi:hypothetical protein